LLKPQVLPQTAVVSASLGVSDYFNAFANLRFAEYKISKIKLPKQSIQIKDLMTP
jgi:hypothetical protein